MLVEERPDDEHTTRIEAALPRTYVVDDAYDYEPHPSNSIAAQAQAAGSSPWSLALEAMMARRRQAAAVAHFRELHRGQSRRHPRDAGGRGHYHGPRRRRRARVHGLRREFAHFPADPLGPRSQARRSICRWNSWCASRRATARVAYGLKDRGVLAPGYRADLNVIDFDQLGCASPKSSTTCRPAEAPDAARTGYRHTFVAGTETLRDDEHTGALPGRLLR